MPVLALFTILENFEFLAGQKDTYIKDIQQDVEDEQNFFIICNEIKMLIRDYYFIREKLPNTFNLGLFHVDLTSFKSTIVENIEKFYVAKLQDCN